MTTVTSTMTIPTQTIHFAAPSSSSSSSSSCHRLTLPSHGQLQAWVQRPHAITKCTIADMYAMQTLVPSEVDPESYTIRDVFLHGQWPCRMVEIVAWVAGVDYKESYMIVTLDDGDGKHVLPLILRFRELEKAEHSAHTMTHRRDPSAAAMNETETSGSKFFMPKKDRKALRKAAALEEIKYADKLSFAKHRTPTFEQVDVRVGDTVRIIGRVEEKQRKRADLCLERIRQVVVAEGLGGSLSVVDPDEQYDHAQMCAELWATTYTRHFEIPAVPLPTMPSSPVKIPDRSDSLDASSEIGDLAEDEVDFKLRDPSKLRPSQLTESTFRQYLLDYVNQELLSSLYECADLQASVSATFPEYRDLRTTRLDKGKGRSDRAFQSSTRDNLSATPAEILEGSVKREPMSLSRAKHTSSIASFTLEALLKVPHLGELARLVVDSETRREEKRRRIRLRDGQARPRDLEVERERLRRGRGAKDWKLTEEERQSKMLRLASWVIRSAAEDGQVVQVSLQDPSASDMSDDDVPVKRKRVHSYGYLPTPPELILPLVIGIVQNEQMARKKLFLKKTDPRRGHGMFLEEIVGTLQRCGTDGRWERVREWVIKDAIALGVTKGKLRQEGRGWWVVSA
ncbi:hypothetical protein BD324DRAFT_614216 [Kockovaella imperatae]|uniref:CST complex subunit Stn1 N-terminal domain-containing protein n=1 Tax=Kockovaella imperatae TaxID=4999 RepID=A0A1Y1UQ43_9TREE|nr:hypothetical protein BD324DRAFT_614216 [Kockovaella imperatae]ORX39576.1 hypothetical protein BD324DRAFT_614216 [Kockovaella imperatae]